MYSLIISSANSNTNPIVIHPRVCENKEKDNKEEWYLFCKRFQGYAKKAEISKEVAIQPKTTARELLFPNTYAILRIKGIVAKAFAILPNLVWDIVTMPIRAFFIFPRKTERAVDKLGGLMAFLTGTLSSYNTEQAPDYKEIKEFLKSDELRLEFVEEGQEKALAINIHKGKGAQIVENRLEQMNVSPAPFIGYSYEYPKNTFIVGPAGEVQRNFRDVESIRFSVSKFPEVSPETKIEFAIREYDVEACEFSARFKQTVTGATLIKDKAFIFNINNTTKVNPSSDN